MNTIKVAPSLLAADYAAPGDAVQMMEACGADWVHFDVMDGHFVPNLTFGPSLCAALKKRTALPLDVHLMADRPADWIDPFLDAGADVITLHIEVEQHAQRQLQRIRDAGKRAGLALSPATPAAMVECVLEYCDLVLVMSVNPGFGGQKFLPLALDKMRAVRELCLKKGLDVDIEVDGGIGLHNAGACIDAGATVLVAGSSIFAADDMREMISMLRAGGTSSTMPRNDQ